MGKKVVWSYDIYLYGIGKKENIEILKIDLDIIKIFSYLNKDVLGIWNKNRFKL